MSSDPIPPSSVTTDVDLDTSASLLSPQSSVLTDVDLDTSASCSLTSENNFSFGSEISTLTSGFQGNKCIDVPIIHTSYLKIYDLITPVEKNYTDQFSKYEQR